MLGAHVDLAPTLLAAAGIPPPPGIAFDGLNLMPLWEDADDSWPERTYSVQSHRGNTPEPHRAFAAVEQRLQAGAGPQLLA